MKHGKPFDIPASGSKERSLRTQDFPQWTLFSVSAVPHRGTDGGGKGKRKEGKGWDGREKKERGWGEGGGLGVGVGWMPQASGYKSPPGRRRSLPTMMHDCKQLNHMTYILALSPT